MLLLFVSLLLFHKRWLVCLSLSESLKVVPWFSFLFLFVSFTDSYEFLYCFLSIYYFWFIHLATRTLSSRLRLDLYLDTGTDTDTDICLYLLHICIFLAYFAFVSRFSRSLISFILLWFLFSTLSKQIVHSKIKIIIANFTCYCICRSRVVLRICRIRFVFSAAQMKLSRFPNAKANSTTATTTTKRQQREPSKRAAGREIAFESSLRARVSHRYLMASLKLSLNLSLSISFECEYRAHWFAYFENTFAAGVDWIECESKEQSKD